MGSAPSASSNTSQNIHIFLKTLSGPRRVDVMYAVVAGQLGTTAVPCQIDTISTPGENQDFWVEEESSKARPDGRKKVSAFRVNVLIDGGRRVAFMHWNFSLQPCYNELKKIAFWSTPYFFLRMLNGWWQLNWCVERDKISRHWGIVFSVNLILFIPLHPSRITQSQEHSIGWHQMSESCSDAEIKYLPPLDVWFISDAGCDGWQWPGWHGRMSPQEISQNVLIVSW